MNAYWLTQSLPQINNRLATILICSDTKYDERQFIENKIKNDIVIRKSTALIEYFKQKEFQYKQVVVWDFNKNGLEYFFINLNPFYLIETRNFTSLNYDNLMQFLIKNIDIPNNLIFLNKENSYKRLEKYIFDNFSQLLAGNDVEINLKNFALNPDKSVYHLHLTLNATHLKTTIQNVSNKIKTSVNMSDAMFCINYNPFMDNKIQIIDSKELENASINYVESMLNQVKNYNHLFKITNQSYKTLIELYNEGNITDIQSYFGIFGKEITFKVYDNDNELDSFTFELHKKLEQNAIELSLNYHNNVLSVQVLDIANNHSYNKDFHILNHYLLDEYDILKYQFQQVLNNHSNESIQLFIEKLIHLLDKQQLNQVYTAWNQFLFQIQHKNS